MLILVWCDLDILCAEILLQVVDILGPRNREEILSLGHDPRKHNLRRRATLLLRQVLKDFDEV